MQRINKICYAGDDGHEMIIVKGESAELARPYKLYNAEELEELALCCQAAAEELRATAGEKVPA